MFKPNVDQITDFDEPMTVLLENSKTNYRLAYEAIVKVETEATTLRLVLDDSAKNVVYELPKSFKKQTRDGKACYEFELKIGTDGKSYVEHFDSAYDVIRYIPFLGSGAKTSLGQAVSNVINRTPSIRDGDGFYGFILVYSLEMAPLKFNLSDEDRVADAEYIHNLYKECIMSTMPSDVNVALANRRNRGRVVPMMSWLSSLPIADAFVAHLLNKDLDAEERIKACKEFLTDYIDRVLQVAYENNPKVVAELFVKATPNFTVRPVEPEFLEDGSLMGLREFSMKAGLSNEQYNAIAINYLTNK